MGVLRKSTNLKFKARIPKRKIADKMWILIMEVEEKLNAEKSAEEEMCLRAIKKYLQKRDHFLTQLLLNFLCNLISCKE